MNKRTLPLITLFIFAFSLMHSVTIEVNQDGSTDFTIIQEAINSSANGDTVLVYPGTYYENIILENISLTLASLEMTTEDTTYIATTIINGNQNGSCIYINNVTNTIIQGFTILNGSGSLSYNCFNGGGLFIQGSNVELNSCMITENKTDIGGGILLTNSSAYLSNTVITNNHAVHTGGGIDVTSTSTLTLDPDNLNSIYFNFAGRGNDLFIQSDTDIFLNTFTISEPNEEFIRTNNANYTFSSQQSFIEQVSEDLFVSADGSDSNSGLTPNEPLKTISYANMLIKADSLNQRSIYIADGVYSTNHSDERFPINMKSYVSIIGESEENTIFDGDEKYPILYGLDGERETVAKNFTIQNCKLISPSNAPIRMIVNWGDDIWDRFTVTLENITIRDTSPQWDDSGIRCIALSDGEKINLKNITLIDNHVSTALHLYTNNVRAENIAVINTQYLGGSGNCCGAAIGVIPHVSSFPEDKPVIFKNLLVVDNVGIDDFVYPPVCLLVAQGAEAYIINGTFSKNRLIGGGSGIIWGNLDSEIHLINSIVHDNWGVPVYLNGDNVEFFSSNSIYTNGLDDIYSVGGAQINWLEGNISGNPLFQLEGAEIPYSLQSSSPCIDAGTTELPDWIEMPEFDLAGNPRIYGSGIDMGCYEWSGTEAGEDEVSSFPGFGLTNYPNPFNPTTTFSFSLNSEITENTEIEIFNIKGQKVKQFSDLRGQTSVSWNGLDDKNNPVSSGIYFYNLKSGNRVVASRKMLLMK